MVKDFYRTGVYFNIKPLERNNRPHVIAFGVAGIRFGEIMYNYTYVLDIREFA